MSRGSSPRFVVKDRQGGETPMASVEELEARIRAGDVHPDDDLFDAGTGKWAPAREVAIFRFIVEEMELEGDLPPALRELAEASNEGDADRAQESGEAGVEDPLDFKLDLADGTWEPPDREAEASESRKESLDAEESEELDDFGFQPGSSAVEDWAESKEDEEPTSPPEEDRSEPSEERWFTPHEEGGMILPDPAADVDGPLDGDTEVWSPEGDGEATDDPGAPPPKPFQVSRGILAFVVVAAVLGGWLLLRDPMPSDLEIEPSAATEAPERPAAAPFPEGLESSAEQVLLGVQETLWAVTDSLRAEMELAEAPPRIWLSGMYLANAGDFDEVPQFWSRYGEFLELLGPRDRHIYLGAVQSALEAMVELEEDEEQTLTGYFRARYERQAEFREHRYASLVDAAESAVGLHEVLVRHQSQIAYSPAVGGTQVSADPILEAVIPDGPVRRDVERAMDRVFRALDRSRGGGVPSADGLRTDLFLRFGDV